MARCRILIVDDDVRIRTLLMRVLEADGHEVSVAATPEEGLQALVDEELPDLLLLDLVLPGMSGLDLMRRVRRDLYDLVPPIVLVSGSLEDLSGAEREEFTATLPKPFKLDALRRIVDRYARPASERRKASGSRFTAVRSESDDDAATG